MGYESRIIVANKTGLPCAENTIFADVLAIFNMSRVDDALVAVFKQETNSRFYFPGDGDNPVTVDKYGSVPKEASVHDVYNCLVRLKDDWGYRRYDMLIAALEYFVNAEENTWDNIVVIHYGY